MVKDLGDRGCAWAPGAQGAMARQGSRAVQGSGGTLGRYLTYYVEVGISLFSLRFLFLFSCRALIQLVVRQVAHT